MSKKDKILLSTVFIIVFLSVGFTFYKTIILQDFNVISSEE